MAPRRRPPRWMVITALALAALGWYAWSTLIPDIPPYPGTWWGVVAKDAVLVDLSGNHVGRLEWYTYETPAHLDQVVAYNRRTLTERGWSIAFASCDDVPEADPLGFLQAYRTDWRGIHQQLDVVAQPTFFPPRVGVDISAMEDPAVIAAHNSLMNLTLRGHAICRVGSDGRAVDRVVVDDLWPPPPPRPVEPLNPPGR